MANHRIVRNPPAKEKLVRIHDRYRPPLESVWVEADVPGSKEEVAERVLQLRREDRFVWSILVYETYSRAVYFGIHEIFGYVGTTCYPGGIYVRFNVGLEYLEELIQRLQPVNRLTIRRPCPWLVTDCERFGLNREYFIRRHPGRASERTIREQGPGSLGHSSTRDQEG